MIQKKHISIPYGTIENTNSPYDNWSPEKAATKTDRGHIKIDGGPHAVRGS